MDSSEKNVFEQAIDNISIKFGRALKYIGQTLIDIVRVQGARWGKRLMQLSHALLFFFIYVTGVWTVFAFFWWFGSLSWLSLVISIGLTVFLLLAFIDFLQNRNESAQESTELKDHPESKIDDLESDMSKLSRILVSIIPSKFQRFSISTNNIYSFLVYAVYGLAVANYVIGDRFFMFRSRLFEWESHAHRFLIDDLILGALNALILWLGGNELKLYNNEVMRDFVSRMDISGVPWFGFFLLAFSAIMFLGSVRMISKSGENRWYIGVAITWAMSVWTTVLLIDA